MQITYYTVRLLRLWECSLVTLYGRPFLRKSHYLNPNNQRWSQVFIQTNHTVYLAFDRFEHVTQQRDSTVFNNICLHTVSSDVEVLSRT